MLASGRRTVERSGLSARVAIAQADATWLDPEALFGVAAFDRIFISYALSMIPAWKDALACASRRLAPGGALHIVDFGDQAGLPAPFRAALARWLALFSVHPVLTLEAELKEVSPAHAMDCRFPARFRPYSFQAR